MKVAPATGAVQRTALLLVIALGLCLGHASVADEEQPRIRIGSKTFAESYILAEIAALLLEDAGFAVERKPGLGGTLIAFQALREGAVDIYPEYTGTLTQAVLQQPGLSPAQLQQELAARELQLVAPLGFNNSYAIAVDAGKADALSLRNISDLRTQPQLRAGFSLEFLNREDGWPRLSKRYRLPHRPSGMEHALAYRGIAAGELDVTDAYSTDGQLEEFELRLLIDDLGFFPRYHAAYLASQDLPTAAVAALSVLQDSIDEETMRRLNHAVSGGRQAPAAVALAFLQKRGLLSTAGETGSAGAKGRWHRILQHTLVHLKLTGIALAGACLLAIPAALLMARNRRLANSLLYLTGLIQTVPSLALLALLIPLFGLGQVPAIIALFLYSLLPIVRNTLTGLFAVDPLLKQVAAGMGLTARQQLWKVELPLAAPMILAGIKTAAIISIGTATLAAFVGAGGLGEPIITGLTLNDHRRILEGALPAALLAIGTELLFELLERAWIPAHLRS
jgi:osmoprotectant transport system permease protein